MTTNAPAWGGAAGRAREPAPTSAPDADYFRRVSAVAAARRAHGDARADVYEWHLERLPGARGARVRFEVDAGGAGVFVALVGRPDGRSMAVARWRFEADPALDSWEALARLDDAGAP